ncbi:hypothetical protein MSAN_02413200 [Mycena sanguinolenta]|uniref:Uncharacterized protein n=1 Tax=Mycena sanguinolenta TaxID=230812 RepID=A0A8H7CDW2_9AGAR|nr:hypothetical protein MSAN_02413200 [Mycena sanguinolenta]
MSVAVYLAHATLIRIATRIDSAALLRVPSPRWPRSALPPALALQISQANPPCWRLLAAFDCFDARGASVNRSGELIWSSQRTGLVHVYARTVAPARGRRVALRVHAKLHLDSKLYHVHNYPNTPTASSWPSCPGALPTRSRLDKSVCRPLGGGLLRQEPWAATALVLRHVSRYSPVIRSGAGGYEMHLARDRQPPPRRRSHLRPAAPNLIPLRMHIFRHPAFHRHRTLLHVALRDPRRLDLFSPSPLWAIMVPAPSFHHGPSQRTNTLQARLPSPRIGRRKRLRALLSAVHHSPSLALHSLAFTHDLKSIHPLLRPRPRFSNAHTHVPASVRAVEDDDQRRREGRIAALTGYGCRAGGTGAGWVRVRSEVSRVGEDVGGDGDEDEYILRRLLGDGSDDAGVNFPTTFDLGVQIRTSTAYSAPARHTPHQLGVHRRRVASAGGLVPSKRFFKLYFR